MKSFALVLLALLVALPAAADVYRWIDNQGRVHYSDMPPQGARQKAQRVSTPTAAGDAVARNRLPVTLYTANCGATCDEAHAFLAQRGVPFTLKNAQDDTAAATSLKQLTGASQVPVLVVGDSLQRGYNPTLWDKMLEMGGYPAAKPKAAQGDEAKATP